MAETRPRLAKYPTSIDARPCIRCDSAGGSEAKSRGMKASEKAVFMFVAKGKVAVSNFLGSEALFPLCLCYKTRSSSNSTLCRFTSHWEPYSQIWHRKANTKHQHAIFWTEFLPYPTVSHLPTSICPTHVLIRTASSAHIHLTSVVKQHRHSIPPKMDYIRTLTQRSASETRIGDRVRVLILCSCARCL